MGASGRSEGDAEGAVVGAVRALVVELHPYEPPAVRLDSDLERDLGLDSLALAELLVRLEDRFGVSLPTAQLRTRVQATTVDILGTPPDEIVLAPPGTVPKTPSGKIRRNEARLRYERGALRPDTRAAWRQIAHFSLGRLRRGGAAADEPLATCCTPRSDGCSSS